MNSLHTGPGPTAGAGLVLADFAKHLAAADGSLSRAMAINEAATTRTSRPTIATVLRAAVGAETVGDVLDATQPLAVDLRAALRTRAAFDRLTPFARRLSPRTKLVSVGGLTLGAARNAGAALPVVAGSIAASPAATPGGFGVIVVETDELVIGQGADASVALRDDLVEATAAATDQAFVNTAAASGTTPAGILHGITPTDSGGNEAAGVDATLAALQRVLADSGVAMVAPHWLMAPMTAIYLGSLRDAGGARAFPDVSVSGGDLAGIPVIVTTGCAAAGSPSLNTLVLIDAAELGYFDAGVTVDSSRAAVLQMDSPRRRAPPRRRRQPSFPCSSPTASRFGSCAM